MVSLPDRDEQARHTNRAPADYRTPSTPKRKHRESEDYPVLSGGEKHYELRPKAFILND